MKFEDLGLSENLLKAIKDCGYDSPTPIQEQAIPHILMARDVVGLAQTGTGKTAAFTMPMIEILDGGRAKARMPRSLILSPTRELAAQIAENFETYGKYTKLSKALLTGGVSMDEQIKKLDRGVDVLIATPGRLLDLFERGRILMTDIKVLVIDEADRMLDMGFIPDIEKIVGLLSPMRQTLLFSATMPDEINRLTQKFLSNPREVKVARKSSTAKNVKQMLVWTNKRNKNQILDTILQDEDVKNAFIFCNRKRDIGALTKWLQNHNYAAAEMHGDMAQAARVNVLEDFKEGQVSLLVCSDVAGRGIDVDEVSHVFNYDVPFNADDYVHRVGRTGRAGNEGRAWMFATKEDAKNVDAIKKLIKMDIEEPKIDGVRQEKPSSTKSGDKSGDDKKSSKGKSSGGNKGRGGRDNKNNKSSEKRSESKDHGGKSKNKSSSNNRGGDNSKSQKHEPVTQLANRRENLNKNNSQNIDINEGSGIGFGDEVPDFFKNG